MSTKRIIKFIFYFTAGFLLVLIQQCKTTSCEPKARDEYTSDLKYYKINVNLREIPTDIPVDARWVEITYNKKVLLRERKRYTTRRVVSTPSVVLPGYPPPGGVPDPGTPPRGGT